MRDQRNREEAVNTQLALLISKLGVTAAAETIHVHGKHRPDVLFQLRGLRVVIEGKFKDTPNAEQIVLDDARKRVRAGIAHIAAGTVYPDELRTAPTTKILDTLADARLRYRIVTETFESESWFEGNPASLMEALRRAQESLTQDDLKTPLAAVCSRRAKRASRDTAMVLPSYSTGPRYPPGSVVCDARAHRRASGPPGSRGGWIRWFTGRLFSLR